MIISVRVTRMILTVYQVNRVKMRIQNIKVYNMCSGNWMRCEKQKGDNMKYNLVKTQAGMNEFQRQDSEFEENI